MDNKPRNRRTPTAPPSALPSKLRAGLESTSGLDLAGVQIHTNSAKPAAVGSLAFTQGSDIHLAPGQEQHLPHDAWHVVQQVDGHVRPTTDVNGAAINDDASLEREADTMGRRALTADEENNLKKT